MTPTLYTSRSSISMSKDINIVPLETDWTRGTGATSCPAEVPACTWPCSSPNFSDLFPVRRKNANRQAFESEFKTLRQLKNPKCSCYSLYSGRYTGISFWWKEQPYLLHVALTQPITAPLALTYTSDSTNHSTPSPYIHLGFNQSQQPSGDVDHNSRLSTW